MGLWGPNVATRANSHKAMVFGMSNKRAVITAIITAIITIIAIITTWWATF